MLLSELVARFELEPQRSFEDLVIVGIKSLDEAQPGHLSFLTNAKYRHLLTTTSASAVLVEDFVAGAEVLQLKASAAYATLAKIMALLYPERRFSTGVHASASIHPNAKLGKEVAVGAGVVIEEDVIIGDHSVIEHHAVIGAGSQLGPHCHLYPAVVLYPRCHLGQRVRVHANTVIGSDGFGYAQVDGRHQKVPQIGRVLIGDDVEIGSNVSIDRGALKDTVIGSGVKIDNLVQIAHGTRLGDHAMIISQSGIAGSAELGEHVTLAGQVGVNGHVKIGKGVLVMGKSVVTKSLEGPGTFAGNPAVPHMQYQRQLANLRALDKLKRRITELERQLNHGTED